MGKKKSYVSKKKSSISAQEFDRQIDTNLNKSRAIQYTKTDKKQSGGGKSKASNYHLEENEMKDEIDVFMEGKNKIDLHSSRNNNNNSDYEEDSDEFQQNNEELDLPDYEEEEENEENINNSTKKRAVDLAEEDEDDYYVRPTDYSDILNTETPEEQKAKALRREEQISKAWGKKKSLYYSADTVDYEIESDEEIAELEEEEAKRLQIERSKQLKEQDYNIGDMINEIVQEEQQKTNKTNNKKGSQQKKTKKIQSDAELLESINLELNQIDNQEFDTEQVEIITKDTSDLSKEEKLEIVLNQSPELIGLLEDLKEKLTILREEIKPLLNKFKQYNLNEKQQFYDYYQYYSQLLLTYCTNLIFYLSLKAEGKINVQQHPIINQILILKQLLQDMEKLKSNYQEEVEEFLENPELFREKQVKKQNKELEGDEYYSEEEGEENNNDAEINLDDFDPADFDEADEIDGFGQDSDENSIQNNNNKQETDDLFGDLIGIHETRVKSIKRKANHLDNNDYGDLTNSTGAGLIQKKPSEKLLKLQEQLRLANEKLAMKKQKTNNNKKNSNNSNKEETVEDVDSDGDFNEAEALAFYNSTNQKSKAKKLAHKKQYEIAPQLVRKDYNPNDREEDEHRAINSTIERNRGLTRNRRKDIKTPKTHNRMRYEKKLKQRHSQVQEYKGSRALGYGGESTGIKTHLTKSISLKS